MIPRARAAAKKRGRKPIVETAAQRIDRFSIPEPNSGCFLWFGAAGESGHGLTRWNGRLMNAHRLSWIACRGAIPAGMLVCHRCDVPACVNPDHLFLGTHLENMADRTAKDRGHMRPGEGNPRARLTNDLVVKIRCSPGPSRIMAALLGVSVGTIQDVRSRRTWGHI